MNVSHDRIIQKMIDELETARHDKTEQTIARHAANVRVLADLLVENAQGSPAQGQVKSMQPSIQQPQDRSHTIQKQDTEPPESIFDF